ncbi:hypothetical protein F2Q68_00020280 [Brassica cretica]|uniref:Uncharacterized protein n=1 Tax=Brassica cretica TaxID=69181 RepID=A0A8S9NF97_BRACR|nr:hypothetical protein F2Q68_00020280 [Brassica cretica]KAF3503784.1 hypothetical protein F2Q69_00041791 [Brassica cretica]
MERDLAPIVEVLEKLNQNTSNHDPSLPSGGKTSRNVSRIRRASLFRRFLAFFCCSATATTMSMSRRCSIQIVGSGSSSPPSNGSSPTPQVGLISVTSLSDELYLSSTGRDARHGKCSTPQRYVLADECETILEQDIISIQSPASEGSDSMQSEDLTSQVYVTSGETVSEQDRGNISGPAGSEERDTTESEDSTSNGYQTADEFSLGDTVSEQDRGNIPIPASEESDSAQYEDSTSHGYVTLDDLTCETNPEQNRGNIPTPAYEGYDSIHYEDSASDIYVTANELRQDNFPQRRKLSIESTFPPQNSAPGTLRRAGRLINVSINI